MPKRKSRAKRSAGWRRQGARKTQRKRKPAKAVRAAWRTSGDGARLLAFDVSSVCVGWAFFHHGRLKAHGKHRMQGKSHDERLANYADVLAALFKEYTPTEVAFEAPFQGRHRNAFAVLSMYKAIIHMAHWRAFARPLPEENQLPAHLIKKVLGVPHVKAGTTEERHASNKRAVVKLINSLYGTSFLYAESDEKGKQKSEDDIADAVAVGHVWYHLHISNVVESDE